MEKTSIPDQSNEHVHRWPEGAIVYHIYPRSFQDSNDDGVGDLAGVTSRLDYLKSLSINAVWLSPFYPSPMADFGYDVSDYCNVDPIFGNLDDFKELLKQASLRDIRVIIDLVPNHTSDEHEWFRQSRLSDNNKFSDWYIWVDSFKFNEDGTPQPPNNWRDALTGGSAWEWDTTRKQFYLHSFDKKQPDLNWSNPAVREAVKEAMRFWLDLGVDGFRIDAVYWMAKEPLFINDSPNPDYVDGTDLLYEALLHDNSRGWPMVYAYLSEMAEVLKEKQFQDKHRFMVTEAYPERHNPLAAYMNFYVGVDPKVAAPFNFEGLSLPWDAASWRRFLSSFHHALARFSSDCIPSYAFGNHDQPRLASRIGEKPARAAATMLLTLPGMAFIYYGEELGMKNVTIPPGKVHDPAAKGDPSKGIGRDPERTPMQWSAGQNAGFTTSSNPWLPLADNYKDHNVETELADPASFLSLYIKLCKLRNESDALKYGKMHVLEIDEPKVLGYKRIAANGETYIILINFSEDIITFHPAVELGKLIISSEHSEQRAAVRGGGIMLYPYEAVVLGAPAI